MALFRGHKPSYDVFLSFRGEDTRKNFTGHLYTALVNARYRTFMDDPELERGENIKEELENAIQQSRSSVIVISKDYTSSRWCLDELVMILERKRTSDHAVVPVFYKVYPSEVRKEAESLAGVPKYHENQSSEKLKEWGEALREVADLAGMVSENEADGHEAKFIQKIVAVIQKKVPLVSHVPLSDLQKELKEKLLFVDPVLDDAEGKQLQFQTSVKPWLHKLKEVVYEAEDLLQEINTEVLRQKLEAESGSSMSHGQELISSPPCNAFDSAFIHPKVEEILYRLDNIMERRRHVLGMEASAGCGESQTISSTSLAEVCVYGRDEEKETLVRLLVSDDESGDKISVIPIVGMGGIGKTTLAQFLYNDVTVRKHFDLQAWVCVSKEFDVLRISQHMYESLTSKACQITNLALLQSMLQATVMGKRFFFVLDDIWNRNYNQLEYLKRPLESGAHGSKIIVTTRNEDVASMMGTVSPQPDCLKPISEEDGWLLFEKHAFTSRGVCGKSQLEEIGRQIVRKCNGLPLALKSLGGLLRSKRQSDEWESILDSEMWELPQEESDILPSLWLSYVHLPPHLKRCFSYCSIFPKNYRLQKSELVFLWKAQGFLQPKKQKTDLQPKRQKSKEPKKQNTEEQNGEEYFNGLISRSFFQRSTSSEHFIMHDLINDLANFVSGEFCVRWEDSALPNILRKTRHFSYMETNGDSFAELEALREAKYLRTLLPLPKYPSYLGTFKKKKFQEVLYEVLPKLQCLRVLNLSMYNIEELPDAINNLKHLRHLDMSETTIRKLPDTICTLYNLRTLLLFKCQRLTALPSNLGRLISLSHLDITGTKIKKMPRRMGDLKDLQILTEFVLDKYTDSHNSSDLKKLQNLCGTLCISGLSEVVNGRALVANIVTEQKFLIGLILKWDYICHKDDMVKQMEALEKLQPHLNLERLTISGYGGQVFPGWSGYYFSSALVYLHLVQCVNCITLPPLGQLPSLIELHICGVHEVVSIGSEFYYGDGNCVNKPPFRCLRSLKFENMGGWREWCYVGGDDNEGGVFPNLVQLHISDCPTLTGRLALDSFPMLKEVYLKGAGLSSLITSSPDSKLLSLESLLLKWCPNIVSLADGGLNAPNLRTLKIVDCENLNSLPEQMPSLLPSLVDLEVNTFRELECNPEGGFPPLLESLVMQGKMLHVERAQNLNNALRRLTSLERLKIDFGWFEFSRGWPSTICYLHISGMKSETIGAKWFDPLNSLQKLEIEWCPVLRCLPDSRLPASMEILVVKFCPALRCLPDCRLPDALARLVIRECPLLHKRCQRETGEDWPKIAHVPHIQVDYI